jgi:type I restriction enzyme R subunit
MFHTDTSEHGLEDIIESWLIDHNGYERGTRRDVQGRFHNDGYDRLRAIDKNRLIRFIETTQPSVAERLGLLSDEQKTGDFLDRLNSELRKRGIIDVLRNGIKMYPAGNVMLYYATPTEGNTRAEELYHSNIFSIMRQLHYSDADTALSVDLCIFINGLPICTLELKNHYTGQTTADAITEYKEKRNPHETLFSFKRCAVHFAVDDETVEFCTKLAGDDSWFLPFNKGYKDGAGNPPNPDGIMSDYLWHDIFTKPMLSRILENYAQVISIPDKKTHKNKEQQIWPRYHQLDCVEKLLADVRLNGLGKRYLIQHSAGSGKSNSIAWLAHQLGELTKDHRPIVDSVIVVTDRRILDKQIRDTIKQFTQVRSTVVWAAHSSELKAAIQDGRRIIITTVEKFPYISQSIGAAGADKHFAIIIDEAHSGQSGRNSANMNLALSGDTVKSGLDAEDKINKIMEGRKLVKTASYFAFTATPKNKTEELFGTAYEEDGVIKHRPFHVYTMKQAIEEGFILDVLKNYVTIDSWYRIAKIVEDDPMYDKKRAQKKLRAFVEGKPQVIAKKAAIIVDHFHEQIIAKHKLNGQSRAMVVTSSISRCIEYYFAINKCLADRHSPYKAIVAFSGEYKYQGAEPALTSAGLNGFPDKEIPDQIVDDPYRLLIVADMFQTGYDEPLLQTMYVDKPLYDIDAVQTLSRLNRACPGKDEVYVLDFANKTSDIEKAFSKYYRTTILSGETDPNKLYDLIADMDAYQVFSDDDVNATVEHFLRGANRAQLDMLLNPIVAAYRELETDGQVKFKSAAKAFARTYEFLGSILPYGNADWERLSIFLHLLIPKLPSPRNDDFSEGMLSDIDLDSYRNEAQAAVSIKLEDQDAEIGPVPTGGNAFIIQPEMTPLSKIIADFNSLFGNIKWNDRDNVQHQIMRIPSMVSRDEKYRNAMRNSDEQEARTESENALQKVIIAIMSDNMELFKQFQDNPQFKRWLSDMVFNLTYNKEGKPWDPPKDETND